MKFTFNPYQVDHYLNGVQLNDITDIELLSISVEWPENDARHVLLRIYKEDQEVGLLESISFANSQYSAEGKEYNTFSYSARKGVWPTANNDNEDCIFHYHSLARCIDFIAIEVVRVKKVGERERETFHIYSVPPVETKNPQIKDFYNKAIDGYTNAMYNVGLYYYRGEEQLVDMRKAMHWWRMAANLKHEEALKTLTNLYAGGNALCIPDGNYRNEYLHAKYAELGTDEGIPYCTLCMGDIYAKGNEKTKPNIRRAMEYWESIITISPEKARTDKDQSFTSSLRAIMVAHYNIGIEYYHGKNVPQNIYKGIAHLEKSANLGYLPAASDLVDIYHHGEYVPKDVNKAEQWLDVMHKCIWRY